ncbi:MAG: hypothetical protein O3A39_03975 [Proteobacteria bacterium]|nr:hypothetical protein [Pseudomonadota bacterium]
MSQDNYYDNEKPEEHAYDPENLNEFFEYLWKKEEEFLKSIDVESDQK